MFVRANFVDSYLQGMRDGSIQSGTSLRVAVPSPRGKIGGREEGTATRRLSGTELVREIKLTDWSMAGNLSNRSSGLQIPRDICARLKRYLYSAKCSWIIINHDDQ